MQASQQPDHAFEPAMRFTAPWRRTGSWLVPIWAVVCGLIASAQFHATGGEVLTLLLALIVAAGLWIIFWSALAETDWAVILNRWRDWQGGAPARALPYTQPGSPAAQFAVILGHYKDWAARDLLPNYGGTVATCIVVPVIALILSIVLGTPAVILCIVAILLPQLAVVLCRGSGQPSASLRSLMEVALPLLLGVALFGPIKPEIVIAAIGFSLALTGQAGDSWRPWRWNAGWALVLMLLVVTRHPLGVFFVALLWLPQFLLQSPGAPERAARHARWWWMASMLVTAVALA